MKSIVFVTIFSAMQLAFCGARVRVKGKGRSLLT